MACIKVPCDADRVAAEMKLLRRELQAHGGEQNDGVQALLEKHESEFYQQKESREAFAPFVRAAIDLVGSSACCVRQEDLRLELFERFTLVSGSLRAAGAEDAANEVERFLCFLLRQPELAAAGAEGAASPRGESASTVDTDGEGFSRQSDSTDFGASVVSSSQEADEEEEIGSAWCSRSLSCPDLSDWRTLRTEPSDAPVEEEPATDYFSDTDSEYGCSYEAPEGLRTAWSARAPVPAPPAPVAPADPVQLELQAPPPPPVPVAAPTPSADAFLGLQACAECGKPGFVPDPSKMHTYTPEQLANPGPRRCKHWFVGLTDKRKDCNCRKCKFCHH